MPVGIIDVLKSIKKMFFVKDQIYKQYLKTGNPGDEINDRFLVVELFSNLGHSNYPSQEQTMDGKRADLKILSKKV